MGIDRRGFLKAGVAQAALLAGASASGLTGCATHPGAAGIPPGTDPFRHGVASGDPLADRVILWTRVSPFADRLDEPIEIDWWIALDPDGREVVRSGIERAWPERDFTLKIDVDGLEPGTTYYYGFATPAGPSPTGRTRTLPIEDVERVRLAVVSCSNYPKGFFNAYGAIAARDDLDAVLHLGDYLYEYAEGEYGWGVRIGRIPDPIHEIVSLRDYRRRHAQYKTDPDLQAAHARHPWITVWDDHESANDSWREGARNHDPKGREGDWSDRKLAAIRAYYEWMPIRELPTKLFRQFRFGDLVDLVMLDTRLEGRDDRTSHTDHEAARDPARTLLGREQTRWLLDALDASQDRGTAWRVIGQQVVFSPTTDGVADFNPDAWDGYRADRRAILDHLRDRFVHDVVFLTGDVHSAWAFDVPPPLDSGETYDPATGAGARAVELVTPAVSSPPLGRTRKGKRSLDGLPSLPHLRYLEGRYNGFLVVDLDRDRARARFVFTDSVKRRSAATRCGPAFETRRGASHLVEVDAGGGDGACA